MIQKTVNVIAKIGRKFSIMIQNSDVYCPRDHYLFHNTFLKIQTQSFKNFFYPKKPKSKDPKSALLYDNAIELLKKKNKKDKKKMFLSQKQEHTRKQKSRL